MGGESIKPIRKRIHVYFLMTAYRKYNKIIKNIYPLLMTFSKKDVTRAGEALINDSLLAAV